MSSALRKLTEAEYLQSEIESPYKREYVDGFVYPLHQAGVSRKHGTIALNIATALHRPARQKGGQVYASTMQVKIIHGSRYYYPDILLTRETLPDDARYAQKPCLIVEVLSDSTRATDLGGKVQAYQSLPSLQGYLLVDTAARAARLYTRTPEGWQESYCEGVGELSLPCVGVTLTLDEVYEGTQV